MKIFSIFLILLLVSSNNSTVNIRLYDKGVSLVNISDTNGSTVLSYSGSYALLIGQSDYTAGGHSRGDKGYIVPVDAPNPHSDDKGFFRKAVAMNQMVTWARNIESKHALFLFDSCFSGTVFKSKNIPRPKQHVEL